MSKPNIRSFRYSDRVAEVLMGFRGCSMNEKFENLVLHCYDELPRLRKALQVVESEIQGKRNEYLHLCKELREVSALIDTLRQLKRYGDLAVKQAESIAGTLPGQFGL